MYSTREEVVNVLEKAKEIIEQKPDLLKLGEKEILDLLDDGTREMISNRWGVAAYAFIEKMPDIKNETIIEKIKSISNLEYLHEYIGFILLTEYQVNLLDLFLYAGEIGELNTIAHLVQENMEFVEENELCKVENVVNLYNENKKEGDCGNFLRKYSNLIIRCNQEKEVFDLFLKEKNRGLDEFILQLGENLYRSGSEKCTIADDFLTTIIEQDEYENITIGFLNQSVYTNQNMIDRNIEQIEKIASKDSKNWKELIPMYVEYVQRYENASVKSVIYKRLQCILEGTIEEKRGFISKVVFEEKLCNELKEIMNVLSLQDLKKDPIIIHYLDFWFSNEMERYSIYEILKKLSDLFEANKYSDDYNNFWSQMQIVTERLRKEQSAVSDYMIQRMTKGSMHEFYFSLGLFDSIVSCSQIASNLKGKVYDQKQAQLVLEGILLWHVDAKTVCNLAFELLEVMDNDNDEYLSCITEKIYGNYPYTLCDIAKEYETSTNEIVVKTVRKILKMQEQRKAVIQSGYHVLDLRPSETRRRDYQRAMMEQNRRMNKQAEETSVFGQIFPKKIMKYGKRNAFIQIGRHNEYKYVVNNYAEISYEMELPQLFVRDELLYRAARQEYWERRSEYAANN